MHAYILTRIHTHIRTYIHIYIHTYERTYIHTYVHTNIVSLDNPVSKKNDYTLVCQGSIFGRGTRFSLLPRVQTVSGAHSGDHRSVRCTRGVREHGGRSLSRLPSLRVV